MKEAPFRKLVIKHLRQMDNTAVIPAEGLGNGTSDLLVNYKGTFTAVELKGSENKYYGASEVQKIFIKEQQDCGGNGFVLRHSKEWKEELQEFLDRKKNYVVELIDWDNL